MKRQFEQQENLKKATIIPKTASRLKKHTQLTAKKEKMMTPVLSTPHRGCSDGGTVYRQI